MNPLDSMNPGISPEKSVWYRFTPSQNMNVRPTGRKSNYETGIGIFTGDYATGLMSVYFQFGMYDIPCPLYAGITYYFEIVMVSSTYPLPEDERAILTFELAQMDGPENDFFADATHIESLPYSTHVNFRDAWYEQDEPLAATGFLSDCVQTVWYKYSPVVEEIVYGSAYSRLEKSLFIMTGDNLADMDGFYPDIIKYEHFSFIAHPGEMVYLQFCAYEEGLVEFPLYLSNIPLIRPYFETIPYEPDSHEEVQFCDHSVDPAGSQMIHFWWDFGDGNIQETSDPCISYRFPVDGEYFIWHKVLTDTGLYAEMSRELVVQSHDVSISILNAPFLGKIGKTVKVSVGVQSHITDEYVKVSLSILGRSGSKEIDYFVEEITPDQGVVEIPFEYTFTSEDTRDGLVIFKAVAEPYSRDFNFRNNQAYSFPVFIIRRPPLHSWNPYPAPIN
jgi:hypothetical protein